MKKPGKNTLLMSVIMSSPGPIVIGLGLMVGQSSTQLADFVRRSIELVAIILSFVVFCLTSKENYDDNKRRRLEKNNNLFVSCSMIISGIIMILIALLFPSEDKGNVIPGLVIAGLGVTANSIFWIRYKILGNKSLNTILITQSKLYRAKTFVDASVVLALFVVLVSQDKNVSFYFDLVGTICVSLYLVYTGITTLIKELKGEKI